MIKLKETKYLQNKNVFILLFVLNPNIKKQFVTLFTSNSKYYTCMNCRDTNKLEREIL